MKRYVTFAMMFLAVVLLVLPTQAVQAQKPIVLGCPLSTAFVYGWDAERGIKLAVEEINTAGGKSAPSKWR